ncbi:stalk domain-containing protein [Paenibacillus sp. SAFN-117]|uniref:stalk domain-containing protein n=1 Tax=Paenibacillus sp. SAFN-117 TaxID=3436860 RepID=UPI003F7E33A7
MRRKLMFTAMMSLVVAASMSIGAWAATSLEEVKASLNKGIQIELNGRSLQFKDEQGGTLYPITYDGNTYLPVRSVAESLGLSVAWDGEANKVLLNEGSSPSALKSFNVNETIVSGPMKMTITQITLDPAYRSTPYSKPVNAVVFKVEVENTSGETVNWSPHQGKLVLNTKEQIETGIYYSDPVGGEFRGEVLKKGNIVFRVESNLEEVTNLTYYISEPYNNQSDRVGDETSVEFELK